MKIKNRIGAKMKLNNLSNRINKFLIDDYKKNQKLIYNIKVSVNNIRHFLIKIRRSKFSRKKFSRLDLIVYIVCYFIIGSLPTPLWYDLFVVGGITILILNDFKLAIPNWIKKFTNRIRSKRNEK